MTKTVRRFALAAAVLIASLALAGCLKIKKIDTPAPPADPSPVPSAAEGEPDPLPPEEITIDEELLANAVALAVAGNGEQYLTEADGLWNAIGWYAALNDRVHDTNGPWLSDGTCDALVAILHPDEDPLPIPERWMSGGTSRETRDGRPGILFTDYERLLGETLGVWRELSQTEEDGTRIIAVTDHLDEGTERFLVYVAFATDPNDSQRKMAYLAMTDPIVEKDLNFTLEDVREQNRISNLLTGLSSVTVDMSDEFGTAYQSFWMKDGKRVYYEIDETMWEDDAGNPAAHRTEFGNYRGVSFNTLMAAEPQAYLWVTANPEDHTDEDYYENYISAYIPAAESVTEGPTYLLDTDDTVSFRVTENYLPPDGTAFDIHHVYTVNKGTLAIQEYRTDYVMPDGSEYAGGFSVSYNGEKLGEDAMKAWDTCRTVTLDIKTEAGERTETVTVPDGWFLQLLADEGVTVYADAALKELTYNYIESGTDDITLYARDEANTLAAKLDISAVTLENVFAANYLTVLTEQYGSVKVHMSDSSAETDTWFFRDGEFVVRLSEGEYKSSGEKISLSGVNKDFSFGIADDGSVTARGVVLGGPDLYDPEYDENNAYLIDWFRGGTLDEVAETDAGYTFRISKSVFDYRCTADKSTLALTEIRMEDTDFPSLYTVEYGTALPAFADTYAKAMQKTRTITCHSSRDAETYDWVFRVPADWKFYFWSGDSPIYADADRTAYAEDLVPADGKDYEFWYGYYGQAARADGLFFTTDQIIDANLITALLKKHGQIYVRSTTGGHVSESQFFRYGDVVIRAEKLSYAPEGQITNGSIGDDADFEIGPDGRTRVTIYADRYGDPPNVKLVDNDGERYANNYFLLWDVDAAEPEYVSETADTVTFSVTSPYYFNDDGTPIVATYTVDRSSLSILKIEFSQQTVEEITYGENVAPFASEFAKAMADSRTVTSHYLSSSTPVDLVCRLPSAWEVELVVTPYGPDLTPAFWANAETSQPLASGIIPPNSGDAEVWVTLGAG